MKIYVYSLKTRFACTQALYRAVTLLKSPESFFSPGFSASVEIVNCEAQINIFIIFVRVYQ